MSWEQKVGVGPFSWERLDDKRASRIAVYHPVDLEDEIDRAASVAWATHTVIAMHDVLNTPLRTAATRIKAAGATDRDAVDVADYASDS